MAGMTFFIALFSKVVSLVFINLQGSETSPFGSFLVHEKMIPCETIPHSSKVDSTYFFFFVANDGLLQ
jgi:hypothetical protein